MDITQRVLKMVNEDAKGAPEKKANGGGK